MASSQEDPSIGVVDRQTEPKRRRRSSKFDFSSEELHKRFENHIAKAQQLFLQNDKDGAEVEATMALRIHPTDHIFALLAVIADSKGQFNRASDFRLLQAFMANDAVLWEELLHEFLQEQLYYKSAVCLQRLSVLETKDKARFRTLQLQLADLYVGLGELKRATNILVSLWNGSRCRDFEVFALLSSLFFQLGRWNSLHRLIESSLKFTFRLAAGEQSECTTSLDTFSAPREGERSSLARGKESIPTSSMKRRVSKRVRFFGVDEGNDNDDGGSEECNKTQTPGLCPTPASTINDAHCMNLEDENDDFDFSSVVESQRVEGPSSAAGAPSSVVSSLYGGTMNLRTAASKKNFLTLVNVHAELLNEEGNFLDTVRLLEFTAGCLNASLLELPPDLLVRLGVAYAFLGGMEQQCREVFQHLVDTCSMEEYGDVLYDAARALQSVGLHAEALMLFRTVRRYHEFQMLRSTEDNVDGGKMAEVKTVFAATLFAEGQCEASLGNTQMAHDNFCRVLEVEPGHLQSRLALGRMCMYDMKDPKRAIEILTPGEDEPPLDRIQLAAELVRVFALSKKYTEAIALGVSVFELVLSSEDGGDTESVAPGSVRRSTKPLSMPTLSRASSAIIPPSSIADIVNGRVPESANFSSGRLTHTLATSIRASSAAFQANLARRGSAPLTVSIYGASAAASTAGGWSRADDDASVKDSSTIFRFNRRSKHSGCLQRVDRDPQSRKISRATCGLDVEDVDEYEQVRKRRREEVTQRDAQSFWKTSGDNAVDDANKSFIQEDPAPEVVRGNEGSSIKENPGEIHDGYSDESADDCDDGSKYELPSLEDISKQFSDPAMQELFLSVSSNQPPVTVGGLRGVNTGGLMDGVNAVSAAHGVDPGLKGTALRITMSDALRVLGRNGVIELAVTVIDCYGEIGRFTEAKEFAFVVLMGCKRASFFRYVGTLEHPLRWAILRAALASQESEDVYRVGVRLLQEQCSVEEKDRVVELLFGVLNRTGASSCALSRRTVGRVDEYPPVLALTGNRYFIHRSYVRALNMYLAALQRRPNDIILCFLVGLCYLLASHQKRIRARSACVLAAWHYLSKYQEAVRCVAPQRQAEAVYNCARALQYLGLHHLSTPLYEQVAYQYSVPDQCTVALRRAARWNLYFTYRWRTGNPTLALGVLQYRQ
ncbi:unnamed protein product [Trypanosoma congolense IL3000]|uniref:WGS project CAEQ00000000 data, annotated contig 55 n=1 Tax=Trypanosoma congolense (strain IL3000) TaxID=1068625 RepID=F9WGU8_TRYCI|nr:unnamed protein product [Trypanosoma congolense IL3000]